MYDVAVIGAGYGGLGAAASLVLRGARVVVFEALNHPGGCAQTFSRDGYRFDAGATISGGLRPDQPFGRWIRELGLDVVVSRPDPAVELRTPGLAIPTDADRDAFVRRMTSLAGDGADVVRRWFRLQGDVADALWPVLDDPTLLPPLSARALLRHAARSPAYARVLPYVGRSAGDVLRSLGRPVPALAAWVDAGCRISVQCGLDEAEAPFALAALDWWWRGTGHVRGGMGALASALVDGLRRRGADVRMPDRVRALRREGEAWVVVTGRGEARARHVLADLLPSGLATLGVDAPSLAALQRDVETGWGAVVVYGVAREPADAPDRAVHLQLVGDPGRPLVEGNHVFLSVSARDDGFAPAGLRTWTASTHVDPRSPPERIAAIQREVRRRIAEQAPEWSATVSERTASPRTFERFTRRAGGWVGGVPRRAGRASYRGLWPRPVAPGLWLVGDATFPGQSTLSAAAGGDRVARAAFDRPVPEQVPAWISKTSAS